MTRREFVDRINAVVHVSAAKSTELLLDDPPGRKPNPRLTQLSRWYKSLAPQEQEYVRQIVAEASHAAVFGFFAVLDGVRQIEVSNERGRLELRHISDGGEILLNDPRQEPLHDLFTSVIHNK